MKKIKLPELYSQWDTRWASETLGNNPQGTSYNLYNYGCLITCLAMVLEYYGKEETPRDMNEDLKDGNGFWGNTGLYNWGSLQRIFRQVTAEKHVTTASLLTDKQMQDIKSALDTGYPVMLQIDVNPKTVEMDMHFVLAIAYNPDNENDFTIADPLGGKERSLKDYLGWYKPSARKTIESYTILEGIVPKELALRDTVIDFEDPEGKQRTVYWYVKAWYDQKSDKANQKEEYERKLKSKDTAFENVNKLLKDAVTEIARKESKVQTMALAVTKLEEENARLLSQNASLYEIVDLIKMAIAKINLLPKK